MPPENVVPWAVGMELPNEEGAAAAAAKLAMGRAFTRAWRIVSRVKS